MCSCRKSRRARSVSAERVGSGSGKVRGGEARQRHRRVIGTGFWNLGKPKTERFQAFNEITFRLRTGATVAFTGGRVGTFRVSVASDDASRRHGWGQRGERRERRSKEGLGRTGGHVAEQRANFGTRRPSRG